MAGTVEAIYRLQSIDAEIDEKRGSLSSVEAELANNEDVLVASEAVRASEETVRELRSRLRSLELDVEGVSSKIAANESALYGGEVTNPKELAGMEQELDYLRRRRTAVEDDMLVLMGEVEAQEEKLQAAQGLLSRTEQRWRTAQSELVKDAEELRSRLATLEAERKETARGVSEGNLAVYESLRRQKGGQAVALLDDGVCQGCRVAVPTSLVQRVRRGSELVHCGSCQRVLYSR
jgi:predicted  nucleic acid-binding Zn-ribbon protein